MLILAIDTSTNIGSFSLFDSEKGVQGEININVKQNHSAIGMKILDNLLEITGINKKEIDKIAVSIGPGSFTGIRIGVGIAKGLAYALKKPIAGVNELELLANNYFGEKEIVSILDARKERVFYGKFKKENNKIIQIDDYKACELDEILKDIHKETIFIGDGAINYREKIEKSIGTLAIFLPKVLNIPRAAMIAELAVDKEEDIFLIEPYYISKSQAEREKENR